MLDKFLTAQDVIPNRDTSIWGGFNTRIYGGSWDDATRGHISNYATGNAGWHLADEMINEGKIYYVHIFRHGWAGGKLCSGKAFTYGGTIVCNKCGRDHLDQPWWTVKVTKDGNAYMVAGEGFLNLQESDNYAFGNTKQEALDNYESMMLKRDLSPEVKE